MRHARWNQRRSWASSSSHSSSNECAPSWSSLIPRMPHAWGPEADSHTVEVGASSRDSRLQSRFTLSSAFSFPVGRRTKPVGRRAKTVSHPDSAQGNGRLGIEADTPKSYARSYARSTPKGTVRPYPNNAFCKTESVSILVDTSITHRSAQKKSSVVDNFDAIIVSYMHSSVRR